jgi:hypothetical protein
MAQGVTVASAVEEAVAYWLAHRDLQGLFQKGARLVSRRGI